MNMYWIKKQKIGGFSLIELLVVISIIGLFSSIILPQLKNARNKASISKSKADMDQLSKSISLMSFDTEVWPNGCVFGVVYGPSEGGNNEITLDNAQAGLLTRPTVGVTDAADNCAWTVSEVNAWNGPYIKSAFIDAWNHPYWFDQDYHPLRDCPSANANPSAPTIAAIVSEGPDGIPIHTATTDVYNCDDVYYEIK